MNDIRGLIFKYFDLLILKIKSKWFTFFVQISCYLRGIELGRKNIFIGLVTFRRRSNSKIIIGNNCLFRSSMTSNLIGINRKCIISTLTNDSQINIGDNCGFSGIVIGAFKSIKLGKNVRCGANTLITDSDWHTDDPRSGVPKEVIIKDNVWLGVNVIVLKGVTIGENSVIGANSVVTKSIPNNVIAAGNPCKIIKEI